MTERVPDAGEVLGVELGGGVGHPALEGRVVPLGVKGPGADLPEPVLVGCAAEPEAATWLAASKLLASRWSVASVTAQVAMATVIWPIRPSCSTHSKASSGSPSRVCPHKVQRLGPQRDGGGTADRVGFSGQALEVTQSQGTPWIR